MKTPLIVVGLLLEAFGLLFLLQGFGVVRWPASSFMIDQMVWAYVGGAMIVAGSVLYFLILRRRS